MSCVLVVHGQVVSDVLGFVRDLPIHSLLSASTLDQLATALRY